MATIKLYFIYSSIVLYCGIYFYDYFVTEIQQSFFFVLFSTSVIFDDFDLTLSLLFDHYGPSIYKGAVFFSRKVQNCGNKKNTRVDTQ